MHRALGAKNKFDFFDGTIRNTTPFHSSYKPWTHCNMRVPPDYEFTRGIDCTFFENSIDMWNELKECLGD